MANFGEGPEPANSGENDHLFQDCDRMKWTQVIGAWSETTLADVDIILSLGW